MKLYLYGHDYKYAAEQMMLSLYPSERPEYPEGKPEGDRVELRLSNGNIYTTASCRLVLNSVEYKAKSSVKTGLMIDDISRDKLCSRIIKTAFYRAALRSGHKQPAWGMLTGVRPGKLFREELEGKTPDAALKKFISDYDVTEPRAILCRDTALVTESVINSLGERDVCLYVGIPFCPTRCSYCSFVSQSVEKSMKLIPPFMDALMQEIDAAAAAVNKLGLSVISIYMGGGTPTTLTFQQLDRLCSRIAERFDLSALREYTVEAGRPDCTDAEKLRIIKQYGATRISINPQTFSDEVLRNIGRRHTAQDIVDCFAAARAAGHTNINMDLIAGLPGDTVEGFEASLRKAIALDPENITVHTLTLKRASNIVVEHRAADYADVAAMLDKCSLLADAGYRPYYMYRQKGTLQNLENIGWAKPGFECLYNIYIMEEVHTILSAGAGGSTKLVIPGQRRGKIERIFNFKYPTEYIDRFAELLDRKKAVEDFYARYTSQTLCQP